MNYFAPNTVAIRYSKGRPNFHDNTINHIKEYLRIENRLSNALDIACGTGLSTQALLDLASQVYGTDSSQAMLDLALQKDKINYQVALAENQPFENNYFDIISVCSGIHWFDIDKFLKESNRLLKSKSWLILYDNFFLAEMEGNSDFTNWHETVYLKAFPAPIRNDNFNWSNENIAQFNFELVKEESFKNAISFNKKELILYFTTQSNIISAVENKRMTYEEIETWLHVELSHFFPIENIQSAFVFGNWIKYLRKKI